MLKNREIQAMADVFRLLSDVTRLSIMVLLDDGEANVTALRKKLSLPQPTVSHHLGILRAGGLVVPRRAGKEVFYSQQPTAGRLFKVKSLRLGPLQLGRAKG
jgi:DNA-binding transcriptional ArsR family regulator